ncbi:arrestin, lateral eye-like [Brevipalpus obovatus]|uniref:arrestin, lateral eye-like n=1 Tax=Brevipalpus obovatus TaxID=246614 RepID=UPI003D9E526E
MIEAIAPLFMALAVAVKVFKKTAPNGKITVYLGSRDFGDHGEFCDTIEGVVVVDEEYLKGRRVYGQIVTTFRYGREEDEIMGLHFSRQLYLALEQVYPNKKNDSGSSLNKLQDKLIRKLGSTAHPFTFELPRNAPPSVTLQPGPEDQGSPLGVEYEVKLFVAANEMEKPQKRNSVAMAIRKLQYTKPSPSVRQPSSIVSKGFMLSPGKLNLEVTLDRELYFHGDKISAHVTVTNYSKKSVRTIKVSVVQHTEVTLVNGHYSKTVASIESKEGCPITPGASFSKVYQLLPTSAANKDRRGIALDGMIKESDTNLASSTLTPNADAIGIVISYVVRVRLYLGAIGGDLTADVPFKLALPDPLMPPEKPSAGDVADEKVATKDATVPPLATDRRRTMKKQMTREMSTDLIFEDFARRRQESEDLE